MTIPLFRTEAVEALSSTVTYLNRPRGARPSVLLAGLAAILALTAIGLFVVPFSRVEAAHGYIRPGGGTIHSISVRPGTVERVYVKNGDSVTKGQALLEIVSNVSLANGHSLAQTLSDAAKTKQQALIAEADASISETNAQLRGLEQKREQLIAESSVLVTQLALARARLDIHRQNLSDLSGLRASHLIAETQYRDEEENVSLAEQAVQTAIQNLNDNRSEASQVAPQIEKALADGHQQRASITALKSENLEHEVENAAEGASVISAPASGRIADLAVTVGSPLTAGSVLAAIVPDRSPLQAELMVPSSGIGFLVPGQVVRLMYDAFPYEHFGTGLGKLTSIGQAPITGSEAQASGADQQPVFRVLVAIKNPSVVAYGKKWPILPGMKVDALITVENRSLFRALIESIH